jgi:hypothetical protein
MVGFINFNFCRMGDPKTIFMKKLLISFFLLGMSLSGCNRTISNDASEVVAFQADVPEVKPKFVRVDVSMSFDSLNYWLNRNLNRSLFKSGESDSFIGFPIEISQQGAIKLSAGLNQQLIIQLPTKFDAKPQIAGLSAGNIHGKMQIKLASKLNFKDFTKAKVSDLVYSYDWLQKPSVTVAGFPINAAPIVDNLLASKSELIRQGLVGQLNDLLSKKSMEGILQSSIGPMLAGSKDFHLNVYGVHLNNFQLNPGGISAECWIQSSANFHPSRESASVFFPRLIDFHDSESSLTVKGDIDWTYFEQMLEKELNRLSPVNPTQVRIQALDDSKLIAKISGFQGEKAEYKIEFVPISFQDSSLGIRVMQTEINGLEGVKKVFSKKIERRLLKYASKFRLDLKGQLAPWLNQVGPIRAVNSNLRIVGYRWNTKGFYVMGEIGGHWSIMK